ncbi:MAG: IPTL-CTERM sorting domain-containing protein [Desulfosalsimonadaceae bacterium]|nr:IPTL-CTERM sorting domain-containing protein [Desulfosalsimonadaceae bacterium]
MKKIFFVLLASFVFVSVQAVQAAVLFTDLGTAAPPATVSTYTLIPFDQAPQAAIADSTDVTTIPGCPVPGTLTTGASVNKRTIGSGWATWSHGYTGVVYMGGSEIVLNLPPDTQAFYFYAEPDSFSTMVISAETDSGASSGDINVTGASGANGFAFYTNAGESITTITVATNDTFMAIGEFGIAQAAEPAAIPTMNEWGLIILSLLVAGSAIFVIKQKKTAC